jgi:hypothetical protein
MPDPQLGATWEGIAPMLLKHDGSYFSAAVIVQQYLPPYSRDYYESVIVGTNEEARTWMGDPQTYIDSFSVEVWGAGAYVEVMEAASARETNGILTLKVPTLGGSGGNSYSVTFVMPPMSKATGRRVGFIQVFTADVENIKVIGSGSF